MRRRQAGGLLGGGHGVSRLAMSGRRVYSRIPLTVYVVAWQEVSRDG
jgi:hypothetical protein